MFVLSKLYLSVFVLCISVLLSGYTNSAKAKLNDGSNVSSKADTTVKLRKTEVLIARKRTRAKKSSRRIKKSTSSYVGRRSRGISTNSKPWKCVPGRLKKVLRQISKRYGRVIINSTHRSRARNRRSGGKRRSYHLRCRAVDFRVRGRTRGLTRWLARHPLVGGYNRYPSGFYHIDTGPKRTW